MGGIWLRRAELIGQAAEIIGYKSGLALTEDELIEHAPVDMAPLLVGSGDEMLRLRSEEVEQLIAAVLNRLGHVATSSIMPFTVVIYHRYKNTPLLDAALTLTQQFVEFAAEAGRAPAAAGKDIDPTPFAEHAFSEFGADGLKLALDIMNEFNNSMFRSPWTKARRVDWQDSADLKELFQSESLETQYGAFIDQRFIDYVAANFDAIDGVNWRKFEGLTGEYFARLGYHVELGQGRDDNNVDARVWIPGEDRSHPPAIIVQCKRQKEKVEKVVVKALYADVLAEKAASGLIVTSSSLSPGARAVRTARGYPIDEADRPALREWIETMRTPGTGVFLAE